MTTYFAAIPAPIRCYDDLIPPSYTPIPLEKRHLTLAYLGPLPDPRAATEALRRAAATQPFTLEFRGLRQFPSPSKPRFLAAVPGPSSALNRLREAVATALAHLSKDRWGSYRPHVSIAETRRKADARLIREAEKAVKAAARRRCTLHVEHVALYEASGPRYRVVAAFRLKR